MDKQALIKQFMEVVHYLLFQPVNDGQFWTAAGVGFVMLAWVFGRTGERMDVPNVEGFAGLVASALATVVMLAGSTAIAVFVLPFLKIPLNLIVVLVSMALSSVVLVVPAIMFWTQSRYTNTLVTWFIALLCGLMIVFAVDMGFRAANGGKKQFERGREHNRAVQDVINAR